MRIGGLDIGWKTVAGAVALAVGFALIMLGQQELGGMVMAVGVGLIPIGLRHALAKAAREIADRLDRPRPPSQQNH